MAVKELTGKNKGYQSTLVRRPDEERGKLCGKENGKDGIWTKKKRKVKTEIERLYKE